MKALDWLVTSRRQAVRSVTKLAGLTACSQLVELENGERYVLRHQSELATNYGINYQQEVAFLRKLEPFGLSPTVVYADENSALLNWIEGEIPDIFDEKLLKSLAEQLALLHTIPLQALDFEPKFATLDLAERCLFLWNNLSQTKQQQLGFSPPFRQITPFQRAICHHDIHLANLVLQEKRLFLIDWEYAAISDPALELALLLQANALSTDQKEIFLKYYFTATAFDSAAFLAKMEEYQPEVNKLSRLWFALAE